MCRMERHFILSIDSPILANLISLVTLQRNPKFKTSKYLGALVQGTIVGKKKRKRGPGKRSTESVPE